MLSWYWDLDNIPSFLINEKSQDSLTINVLNNINIDDEIQIIVERNGSRVEEVESDIHSISSNLTHLNSVWELWWCARQ